MIFTIFPITVAGKKNRALVILHFQTCEASVLTDTIEKKAKKEKLRYCAFPWLQPARMNPTVFEQLIEIERSGIKVLIPEKLEEKIKSNSFMIITLKNFEGLH